ncbi:MAG: adenylate/guanylate cyclase domain-containing protein [Myxococcales bacterium]
MRGSTVYLERVVECRSAPEALWPILADTERFNRAVGLSRIDVRPLEGAGAARFLIATTLGGFRVEYEERPAEFVENERFKFLRVLRRGPVRSIETGFELRPRPLGTDVVLSLRIAPRWSPFAPIARLNGWRTLRAFAREVARIDSEATGGGPIGIAAAAAPADVSAFGRAAAALRMAIAQERRALAEKLVEHVRTGPDVAVSHIRPFELADAWMSPRREVLAVCLQAVVAGLLELSWDLVCPSCRTAAERTATLANLGERGHCQLCDLSFGLDLDRAVEATFRPPRPVRDVDAGPYCISGPARTPHVVTQALLPPGSEVKLPVPQRAGRLRLFVRGGATASVEVHGEGPVLATAEASEHLVPATLVVRPGGVVAVRSALPAETHVKLERSEWIDRAATASAVGTLPEFRRLFSGEVLAPGIALKIGRTALLFSDLSASTALYCRAGDASAFRLVRDSFEVLRTAVERNGGALVKTIGDAVMAAFTSDEDAVRAAIAMQRAFPEFIRRYHYAEDVDLKVGIYSGPCFAVTANGVLDYFGQTVNIAARLQSQAEAGELVLAEELADAAIAAGWLADIRVTQRYVAALKGIDRAVRVVRIRPGAAAGPSAAVG